MKWYEFYKNRINSSYQCYFEDRYRPFLEMIISCKVLNINEIGCGIGSVSKSLLQFGINCGGFDNCPSMVELANKNLGMNVFRTGDLFRDDSNPLNVSHGVLEHFSDEDIKRICSKFEGIHYVPLDKYETPSFGDERLLSPEYWFNLVKPKKFLVFNNGYDLAFQI